MATITRSINPIHALLDRLERVRAYGSGRWTALCPSHEDRSPSLSVRETDNGTILVHCFAGCSLTDVMASIGLSLSDLFPGDPVHHLPSQRDRKHFHAAREALKSLDRDILVVQIAGENVARGVTLTEEDRELLSEATTRIAVARRVVL